MSHQATICLLDISALGEQRLAPYEAWLGAAELARLTRFVRPIRRRQFIAGRALLRQQLAAHLDCAPAQIVLTEREGQAPALGGASGGPFFSLSHSGDWVACALSTSTPLGLDIERCDKPRDTAALAAQLFDQGQQDWLAAQPAQHRQAAFYQLWCRMEAHYKLGHAAGYQAQMPELAGLAHASLAIALCSADLLQGAPQVQRVELLT